MFARITMTCLVILLSTFTVSAQKKEPTTTATRSAVTAPRKPPALTLEIGDLTPGAEMMRRPTPKTVCAGDRLVLRASSADTSVVPAKYAWVTTGGKIVGDGADVYWDTTGLAPGTYHITTQAVYSGMGLCNGDCAAYDTKSVRIGECTKVVCPASPVLSVSPEVQTVRPGTLVNYTVTEVSGGEGYGRVTYTWSASAGKISGRGLNAQLDTTDLAPGSEIEVTVKATTEFAECEARGNARVLVPRKVPSRELTPCTTFRKNSVRVDNACKYVLMDAARALQADPQARLVVDAYRRAGESRDVALSRGKNVRDRLADGSIGMLVDPNRIVVREAGESADDTQVRIHFLPEGAEMPAGGSEIKTGNVTPERKTSADVLQRRRNTPRR